MGEVNELSNCILLRKVRGNFHSSRMYYKITLIKILYTYISTTYYYTLYTYFSIFTIGLLAYIIWILDLFDYIVSYYAVFLEHCIVSGNFILSNQLWIESVLIYLFIILLRSFSRNQDLHESQSSSGHPTDVLKIVKFWHPVEVVIIISMINNGGSKRIIKLHSFQESQGKFA